MSNGSLKEQLQALTGHVEVETATPKKTKTNDALKKHAREKPNSHRPMSAPRKDMRKDPRKDPTSRNAQSDSRHQGRPPQKMSQRAKPKWLDTVQYGLELLKVTYPACFKGVKEVKPLKIGIKQDLVLRLSQHETLSTDDKACMLKALVYYVNTISYYRSVLQDVDRIDLDGVSIGKVTAEEATYSLQKLTAKIEFRRQQKQGDTQSKTHEGKEAHSSSNDPQTE